MYLWTHNQHDTAVLDSSSANLNIVLQLNTILSCLFISWLLSAIYLFFYKSYYCILFFIENEHFFKSHAESTSELGALYQCLIPTVQHKY